MESDNLPGCKEFARTWAHASGVIHEVVDREEAHVVYVARAPRTEGIPLPAPYNRPDRVVKAQAGNVWFDRFINGEDV